MARTGTVKWFNDKKGFGFIVDPEVASDIFVHYSQIIGDGYKRLTEGDQVEYELHEDEKGAKARNVTRVATSEPEADVRRASGRIRQS